MKIEYARTNISYLFSFFAALLLFVITIMTGIRFTFMNQRFFLNQMNDAHYYEKTAIEMNRKITQLARGAGFHIDSFSDFINEEDIRLPMIAYERKQLSGETATINTNAFQKMLKQKVNTYIEEHHLQNTSETQIALQTFLDNCEECYLYFTQFPYLDQYGHILQIYRKFYMFFMFLFSVLTAILFYLTYKIDTKNYKRYYTYSLLGSGLMVCIAPLYLYFSKFFEKINIQPEYLYHLLVSSIHDVLKLFIFSGVILFLFGLYLMFTVYKSNHRKKENGNWSNENLLIMDFVRKEDEE